MREMDEIKNAQTALGIELGSTNIKAVLTGLDGHVLAKGSHHWENHLTDGIWTYPYEEITEGLRDCYGKLRDQVKQNYGLDMKRVGAIGISAMMHGIIAL
ncbi:MAG: ATPase, partial [Eubacterium sp.]|nr:ATPase [Eubacterium sp.]